MAMVGYVLDIPTQTEYFRGLMAKAKGITATLEIVQQYLASWSKERIANVQKIDAGWAPFDEEQRPLEINGAADVRCIRDAVHCHCMALGEAGLALSPELLELDQFFFAACEMVESHGPMTQRARLPATPSRSDVLPW